MAGVLPLLLLPTLNAEAQRKGVDQKMPDFFITYEGTVTDSRAPEGKAYRAQALLRLRNSSLPNEIAQR